MCELERWRPLRATASLVFAEVRTTCRRSHRVATKANGGKLRIVAAKTCMKILSIETSCDETAVSVMEADGDLRQSNYRVPGNALYSQAALHNAYGGVYPNLAKREHQKNLVPLTIRALTEAHLFQRATTTVNCSSGVEKNVRDEQFRRDIQEFLETTQKPDIDLIAVTNGPGLEPALWAGISFARALDIAWNIPAVGINHMEGHIVSAFLQKDRDKSKYQMANIKFPLLALLISGGHTELVLMKEWFQYELIGKTRDDAVGEAFDKVARILGMPYPGGPEIDRATSRARTRTSDVLVSLPRPMLRDDSCDFSFSGLKTAVLYLVRDMKELSETDKENIAREFENAVSEVLVAKTARALEKTHAKTLVVGGGVSANTHIREGLESLIRHSFPDVALRYPEQNLTGDNAIMIGVAAYLRYAAHRTTPNDTLEAVGSLSLAES